MRCRRFLPNTVGALIVFVFWPLASCAETSNLRLNVVVLLADDLGYSDLGCYGGEIETPNIDKLARQGLQFTHFRATPMCVTSRVALMSGMPFHRAGSHDYSNSTPMPVALKSAGYRTAMVGKWHAGKPDPRDANLFDRAFGFLGGATDSFKGGDDWFLDRGPFSEFGSDFYSTHAFADRAIEFIDEAVALEKPFFAYVAFNAPHHPCQAPKSTFRKYLQRYRAGFDAIRVARHRKQLELGIVQSDWAIGPSDICVRRWRELTAVRREVEAGRMAAYAAAVDEVDRAVGRIVDHIDASGLGENTVVFFMSDNGGDYSNGSITTDELQLAWSGGSNPTSSNGWAEVKCTPFRYFKHSCHEGGIAVPFIVRHPQTASERVGQKTDSPADITDLYPTILETADAKESISPRVTGRSLVDLLKSPAQETLSTPRINLTVPRFQWYQFSRAWIDGNWKAVQLYGGPWELFDLASDRCETRDLAMVEPQRLTTMIDSWRAFAADSDVPDAGASIVEPQRHWGWHRLKMAAPALTSLSPANGALVASGKTSLELSFRGNVSFANTDHRWIELYRTDDEADPIWRIDPTEQHRLEGESRLVFRDVPPLEADTSYSVRWDAGWIKVDGRPVGPLNDGAYWWRFRTAKSEVKKKPASAPEN